jgi:hypothetical protein
MRTRRRATIEDLRLAIECLPTETKIAMLEGLCANQIIVGAYSDENGICPMLAAHRAGGRTSFISFAKAWDRFAFRESRGRTARRATSRELLVLRSHLEASLLSEDGPAPELAAAIAEHRALMEQRPARARPGDRDRGRELRRRPGDPDRSRELRRRPGDPDRSRELRKRPGWSWMRVVRRYDEYERALAQLESEQQALARAGGELERRG